MQFATMYLIKIIGAHPEMFCILVVPELLWFRQSLNCKLSGIKMIWFWIKIPVFTAGIFYRIFIGRGAIRMQKYFRETGYFVYLFAAGRNLVACFLVGFKHWHSKLPLAQIYTVIDQLQSDLSVEAAGRGAAHDIVWLLRLPRLVLAAGCYCGLACCGVIMQAIVKILWLILILGISSEHL